MSWLKGRGKRSVPSQTQQQQQQQQKKTAAPPPPISQVSSVRSRLQKLAGACEATVWNVSCWLSVVFYQCHLSYNKQ